MPETQFDYIIVGGGSAGCVLANRLTEDASRRVLLIEAGGSARRPEILVPGLSTRLMGNPLWDWCYAAEPDASRLGRVDVWPAGKVLGGGSAINGMVYLRGHRDDYDRWERAGAQGWSYADCLPYFLKCESNERLRDAWHGQRGPLHISDVRADHPLNQMFIDACVASGMKPNSDVNGAEQEGVGRMQTNQRGGMRDSTARAYLEPARARANLTVMTGAFAQRLRLANGRAIGVEIVRNGTVLNLDAKKEVIVSTGSLSTPKLLMLSGIGPREELERHGIACQIDLPGVGANLQEHPGVIVDFEMTIPTLNRIAHSPIRYLTAALQYAFSRRGPASSPIAHVVGFFKTDPHAELPDVQLHFAPFSYEFDGKSIGLAKSNRVGVAINVCRPETRGTIRLRSADPQAPPIIDHQLMGSRQDVATLIRAGRMIQQAFKSSPLREACAGPVNPGPEVHTDADWEAFLRERGFLMYHPVGTCRMGSDAASVVDPKLRLRQLDGLRIVDASVMPTVPAANTNGPTIMLAEKAADIIRADA